MMKNKVLAILMPLLLVVSSSPYFIANILSFHGHDHLIVVDLSVTNVSLTLQHHASDSHDHADSSPHHKNSKNEKSNDHYAQDVKHVIKAPSVGVSYTSPIANVLVKFFPVIIICAISFVLSTLLEVKPLLQRFSRSDRKHLSLISLQTTVLRI